MRRTRSRFFKFAITPVRPYAGFRPGWMTSEYQPEPDLSPYERSVREVRVCRSTSDNAIKKMN